jgi:hypothetical protein
MKICANALCQKSFEPTRCRTPHRQRYCPACVSLSATMRRRTEPIPTETCKNPKCGKTFSKRCKQQVYCCTVCRIAHDQSSMSRHNGASAVAKCPRCGKHHKTGLDWQGRGTPLIFCVSCNAYRCSETFCGTMVDHVGMGNFI